MQAQKALCNKIAKNPKETLANLTEDEIASVIQYANYQYHQSGKPALTDAIFDLVKAHLEGIDPRHPILKHVGAVVDDDERKVKLPFWMGSMDKVKADTTTLKKWSAKYAGLVLVSDKLDGVSGLYYWKDGKANLFTRGNGDEGQTATHLLPFIRHVPSLDNKYDGFAVRGELIMSKHDFESNNDIGANARNTVAGLLNAKLPNLEIAKLVQFVAYELIVPVCEPSKQMKVLAEAGFKVVPHEPMSATDLNAENLSNALTRARMRTEFEIDGIIVSHDAIYTRIRGENPKHAFAFKSIAMMNRAEVVVTGVEWNVSKDGYIKPVVLFDDVQLGGVTVKRATGFNAKFIKDNVIGPGAIVVVMRSGDVIPNIVEVLSPAVEAAMPDRFKYAWNETGIDIVADSANTAAQDDVKVKKLVFFFSKVKVKGLSEGIIQKLCDAGIDTVGAIVSADKASLLLVDGFKDKLADKILSAIKDAFIKVEPIVLMDASNAFGRGLGEKKLALISAKFPKITTDVGFVPNVAELVSIPGIEKKTAEQFVKGLSAYWKFARTNGLLGHHQTAAKVPFKASKATVQIFEGKVFVFTGVRSDAVETYIKERGGIIKSSVPKRDPQNTVLVCKNPDATTGKIADARALGVVIVSFDDFVKNNKIAT